MIIEQSKQIISEINRAFIGKNDIIEKVLMTICAGGHVLLEDCPGVGKTTLAAAFSRALGLSTRWHPVHPDTLPSDITGFTMWNCKTGEFEYRDGAANCQLLLADEINRTSRKTQSALLEVSGGAHHHRGRRNARLSWARPLSASRPRTLGSAGTGASESQLDRFMVSPPSATPRWRTR